MNQLPTTPQIFQALPYSRRNTSLAWSAANVQITGADLTLAAQCKKVLNRHVEPIWIQEGRLLHQLSLKLATTPAKTWAQASVMKSGRPAALQSARHCLALCMALPSAAGLHNAGA